MSRRPSMMVRGDRGSDDLATSPILSSPPANPTRPGVFLYPISFVTMFGRPPSTIVTLTNSDPKSTPSAAGSTTPAHRERARRPARAHMTPECCGRGSRVLQPRISSKSTRVISCLKSLPSRMLSTNTMASLLRLSVSLAFLHAACSFTIARGCSRMSAPPPPSSPSSPSPGCLSSLSLSLLLSPSRPAASLLNTSAKCSTSRMSKWRPPRSASHSIPTISSCGMAIAVALPLAPLGRLALPTNFE
mmetsp:Transcript_30840/g.98474  ORF Transcript_30840/g.98474 Transcript_30840/m.98474 type:complete len:246 (+) Transcript_30840:848-1585(+)